MNIDNLNKMIEEKYISVQKHPEADLWIYNYTEKAQYDRVWNNETLSCRGLIMNDKHEIIARPFQKFFNLDEAINQGQQLPIEDFIITEKMDGSLGILYWLNGKPYLATRGSFVSDQALIGTKILHDKYNSERFNPEYTYLFEIIYPDNRIVVDYKGERDIYLLAIIETQTGQEPYSLVSLKDFEAPIVKHYDGIEDVSKLKELQQDNHEGFVIRYKSGKRYKVKFDEYVRLHRLVTGVNARSIWDLLRNEQPFDELLERVPDEFYQWVKKTKADLEYQFNIIDHLAVEEWEKIKNLPTRKDQALAIKDFKYKSIVFSLLDKKPYAESIWKLLKPSAEKPFKEEI